MTFNSDLLIGLLIGSLGMFIVTMLIVVRYFRNLITLQQAATEINKSKSDLELQTQDLLDTKKALQGTISDIYHKNIFPEVRRSIGLFVTAQLECDLALKDAQMAEDHPNHHRYYSLVRKKLEEVKYLLVLGEQETRRLSTRFEDIVNKYQEFQ